MDRSSMEAMKVDSPRVELIVRYVIDRTEGRKYLIQEAVVGTDKVPTPTGTVDREGLVSFICGAIVDHKPSKVTVDFGTGSRMLSKATLQSIMDGTKTYRDFLVRQS